MGANQTVLQVSVLGLCYFLGEYCAPAWERSAHANKVDNQLSTAMRFISGALKAPPIQWLPTMAAIAPPHLIRKAATSIMHQRIGSTNKNIPLKKTVAHQPATTRLKSRRPFYNSEKQLTTLFWPARSLTYAVVPHDPRMWRKFSNLAQGYRRACLTGVIRYYY